MLQWLLDLGGFCFGNMLPGVISCLAGSNMRI